MNFRSKHWSVVAVMAAVLLALAGLTTSATAATARTVTIKATPAYEYAGKPFTLSGVLSRSPTGTTVKVERKSGTTWVAAGQTTTTTAAGAYSVAMTAPATAGAYTYRAFAPATATLAAAFSTAQATLTVLNKTTATLNIAPSSVVVGQNAAFTGTVSPFTTGQTVTVQRLSGSTWVNVTTATANSSGAYAVNVKPSAAGTFSYRTSTALNGLNAGTTSPVKSLTATSTAPPVITTTTLPNGDQGLPYSATLTKTGGAGTWAIAPGPALKPGLSLNPSTGVISGTPTGNSTSNFTVTFTETGTGLSASKTLSMYINPLPTITTATLPDATQGVAYSAPLAKTGKAGTWSIQNLPAGLSINPTTGVISGTTNVAASTYGVYPTFTETAGGRSTLRALALKVLPGQVTPPNGPTITTTTLPDGDQGLPYNVALTKTGGAGTWAIAPGPALKPGLSLNPSTGVISGTPTGNSTSNFTVTFTETGTGLVASKKLTMYISPLPTITTATLPDATRNAPYSTTLAKTGKAGTWSIQNLPAGLSINPATGEISGTTAVAVGDYGVYPTFTETSTGRSTLRALALHVGGTPLAITTATALPDGHRNLPYSVTFAKTGGAGTWSGQVPEGFTLNPATGTLTGTPSIAAINAVYITFTENTGGSVTKIFSLKVLQPKITTTSLPTAVTGTPYSHQLTKTGLDGTWSFVGFLPAGLDFTTAGLISGTPTETGEYQLLVTFTETSTEVATKSLFVLHAEAPGSPTITTASLPNGVIGTPYSATLAATPTSGTWSVTTGSLPVGLELNAATGAVTGTPIVAEDAQFVVTYTKGNTQNTKFFRLVVPAAP